MNTEAKTRHKWPILTKIVVLQGMKFVIYLILSNMKN